MNKGASPIDYSYLLKLNKYIKKIYTSIITDDVLIEQDVNLINIEI